jgi:hypothetical protein
MMETGTVHTLGMPYPFTIPQLSIALFVSAFEEHPELKP